MAVEYNNVPDLTSREGVINYMKNSTSPCDWEKREIEVKNAHENAYPPFWRSDIEEYGLREIVLLSLRVAAMPRIETLSGIGLCTRDRVHQNGALLAGEYDAYRSMWENRKRRVIVKLASNNRKEGITVDGIVRLQKEPEGMWIDPDPTVVGGQVQSIFISVPLELSTWIPISCTSFAAKNSSAR